MRKDALEIAAIALMGIVAGVVLSHILQAGPKAGPDAEHYLTVQQTLYQNYRSTIGVVETVTLIVLGVIAWSDRKTRSLRYLSLIAFGVMLSMFGIWAAGLHPINLTVSAWTTTTMPAGWPEIRDRWHQLHALRAGLACIGLVAVATRVVLRSHPATFATGRPDRQAAISNHVPAASEERCPHVTARCLSA